MKLVSLIGQKYGKLTVLSRHECNDKFNKPLWVCKCECGNIAIVGGNRLKSGNTKSCGCLIPITSREQGKRNAKHGMKGSRIYEIWHGIKARCYNPNNKDFKNYGARGITVCTQWENDFEAFYNWAAMHGYAEGLTIDRIDNDGNYEPSNCRWVSTREQNRNKRNIVWLEYNGATKTLSEWSRETGISVSVISNRLKRGWSIEDALTIKPIVGRNGH